MKRFHHLLWCALLLMVSHVIGCKKQMEVGATGSISGKYNLRGSAKNITAVAASDQSSSVATLDSSNGFSIANLQPGNYTIKFTAMPGFTAPGDTTVGVKAGEHVDMGTIIFKVDTSGIARFGSISGKVLPASAVSHITINTSNGMQGVVKVDSAGHFSFVNLYSGYYTVQVSPATGFVAPADTMVRVIEDANTDMGAIILTPVIPQHQFKAVDTLTENIGNGLFLSDQGNMDAFAERAKWDSAIVLTANLTLSAYITISTELQEALNKIIVIKGWMSIANPASLSFTSLKELGSLYINHGGNQLKSVNLDALQTITYGGISIYNCPLLTLKISGLRKMSGTLSLDNIGWADLKIFENVLFTPRNLQIQNNGQLTSIEGLHFTIDSVFDCTIKNNAQLISLDGLQVIKRFRHEIKIINNPALQNLTGLQNAVFAKQLTLTNNRQLNAVCAGKKLISYLKNQPPYKELVPSGQGPSLIEVTKQPLVVSSNAIYAIQEDLLTAIQQCP